jgi:hypothetical protein
MAGSSKMPAAAARRDSGFETGTPDPGLAPHATVTVALPADLPGGLVPREFLGVCGDASELWRAQRADNGAPLLLKRVPAGAAGEARRVVLQREFELIERLQPPGVPLALEQLAGDGGLVCVFADAPGVPLSRLLHEPIAPLRALRVALDLLAPLAVLHREQLCHQDLRPSNVLVDPDNGGAWLVDLSRVAIGGEAVAARAVGEADAYRAPEQSGRMNRPVDHRSDLYALGVLLYRMLAGHLPFEAGDALQWAHAHLARVPVPLATRVAGLPATLLAIVDRLLAKAAADRYQSAAGLRHDLQRCVEALHHTGSIAPFELATCDVSDRFTLPPRLYGRDGEIERLRQAWQSVAALGVPQFGAGERRRRQRSQRARGNAARAGHGRARLHRARPLRRGRHRLRQRPGPGHARPRAAGAGRGRAAPGRLPRRAARGARRRRRGRRRDGAGARACARPPGTGAGAAAARVARARALADRPNS